ncbi:MAG: AAA family ATPase [Flammeovirgaceae bacterium]
MESFGGAIDILKHKKQIILQGPPGTGKTYLAKDLAEHLIYGEVSDMNQKHIQKQRLQESEQFELIQFHPSYTYEDFVRGISTKSDEGQLEYITENRLFVNFAQRALENLKNSSNEHSLQRRILYKELLLAFAEYIQDCIDGDGKYPLKDTVVSLTAVEVDAFRYTGDHWAIKKHPRMKFDDLLEAFLAGIPDRQGIKNSPKLSGLAKQHASYFIRVLDAFREWLKTKEIEENKYKRKTEKEKSFILLIDEINRANLPSVLGELIYALEYRGEQVQSMYAFDGDHSLTIPENLYLIGTMNTADRSVGHIDYAIRRRFAFIDVLPNELAVPKGKARKLFLEVAKLFSEDYLAPDFKRKDVQIGHSYFFAKDDDELQLRLQSEIIPMLEEYMKDGILLATAQEKIQALQHV